MILWIPVSYLVIWITSFNFIINYRNVKFRINSTEYDYFMILHFNLKTIIILLSKYWNIKMTFMSKYLYFTLFRISTSIFLVKITHYQSWIKKYIYRNIDSHPLNAPKRKYVVTLRPIYIVIYFNAHHILCITHFIQCQEVYSYLKNNYRNLTFDKLYNIYILFLMCTCIF